MVLLVCQPFKHSNITLCNITINAIHVNTFFVPKGIM